MLTRLFAVLLLALPLAASAQMKWQEGAHYSLLTGSQTTGQAPGKIEVTEVFSFGCVHCFRAKDAMARLAAALPPDAAMTYVHASFLSAEGWPMFQRAYYTARALGIAETTHEALFKAVWETGEIPLMDTATGRVRRPLPTIEDAAKFYARVAGVKEADFLKVSNSPAVATQIARADELVKLWKIPGTPSLVVNGRYLVDSSALSSWDEFTALVNHLIGLERARLGKK
ncbi:MAG: thiol:disulfide interchange protein DsbA/DsbL [Steroidobacteraceae bacterium]